MSESRNMSESSNIIVCPPTGRSIRKALKLTENKPFKWVYFSENVLGALALQALIGDKGEQIDIAEELQETAKALRQPYIDYIGQLNIKHTSMHWWAASLSEKSPSTSKIFLYSCYLKVALSLLESDRHENLILFAENRSLRVAFLENMSDIPRYNVISFEPKFKLLLEPFKDWIEFIIKHGWFLFNNIYRIVLTRHIYHLDKINSLYKNNISKSNLTLVHSWVDQRCFAEDNSFKDFHFETLISYMIEKGKNVAIVPSILHTVPYTQTVKKLINCGENFLFPSAFLKISDILSVLKCTFLRPVKTNCPPFENIYISNLIFDNRINDWKNTRLAQNLLMYYVVKNWKNVNLSIEQFIYTCENHTWEKLYCIAFREFFPKTHLIGYQHSTICKYELSHSISQYDSEIVPSPDVIITNGNYFKQFLLNSGYDPRKVVSGGAIRYKYICDLVKKETFQVKNNKTPRSKLKILVATSIYKSETIELIQFVSNIFKSVDSHEIILKFHPLMPFQEIADEIGIKTLLPEHFVNSSQPVSLLLNECDVLLYKTTTICVEALATGVYPIHIKSNYAIDCDILEGIPEDLHSSFRTEAELLCKLKELLETTPEETYKRDIAAKHIVIDFFGPVNDSVLELFMKNTKNN